MEVRYEQAAVRILAPARVGTVAGSLLGSALATGMISAFTTIVRNADGTPLFDVIAVPGWLYAAAIGGAIVGGIAAAALPARAAARLDPAQAIRM